MIIRRIRFLGLLILGAGPAGGQAPLCDLPLPTRAFVVEGGAIALRAFVARNGDVRPGASGDARYPTAYILIVTNETDHAVWAGVDCRSPVRTGRRGTQTS
jgi:hypothetical protein